MFVAIENAPLRYAWGARGALSEYLGANGALRDPELDSTGEVPIQAEIWLGAHEGSPSRIVDSALTGGANDLAEWIRRDPVAALGDFASGLREGDQPRLPFLLKLLAAGQPLSLQVHPPLERARDGFAEEEAAGVSRSAPNRNYRDPFHKPELLIALSPRLLAVAGFRDFDEVRELVASVQRAADDAGLGPQFARFAGDVAALGAGADLRELVGQVLSGSPTAQAAAAAVDAWLASPEDGYELERENLRLVREAFPDDAGALTVLLMNHLELRRGESLYVRSGTIHAYLEGVGVEVMAASDNVLRGGLTPKHIDAAELLGVLDCEPGPPPRLEPSETAPGCTTFGGRDPDFMLRRVTDAKATLSLHGPGIALCLSGSAQIRGSGGNSVTLEHGEAVYITAEERELEIEADDLVLASCALDATVSLPLGAEHAGAEPAQP